MTVGIGSRVPVAVTARPHPDSRSCRVVDTTTVTGRLLSFPSFPDASTARLTALRALWAARPHTGCRRGDYPCPARPAWSAPRRMSPVSRVEQSADLAHAVGLLLTDDQRAAPGPVDVAEVAVRMHQRHQPVGGPA